MIKTIPISVYEVVGSPLCVAPGDGEKVHSRLGSALKHNQKVLLSFRNVSVLTSAFLNAAIGQLYGEFDEKKIRASLEVEDIDSDDVVLLKLVVDTAKRYFGNPERFSCIAQEVFEGDGDGG